MRALTSTAFEEVALLSQRGEIDKLYKNSKLELYNFPFQRHDLLIEAGKDARTIDAYTMEDIAFVNTTEFTKTGREFIKNKTYTKLHPIYDKREYIEFWDREEDRIRNGMTAYGKLYKNSKGIYELQKIHITGEHYGYLNYGIIKASKEFQEKESAVYSPNGEVLFKNNRSRGGSKELRLPDFWDGDYYYFKTVELCRLVGQHLVVGKARRKGYSYKNGYIVANRLLFNKNSTSVVGAYDKGSLFEDGTMNKVQQYLDHFDITDFKKRRLHNLLEYFHIGFRYNDSPRIEGYNSKAYGVILSKDAGGMRGKDADLGLLEEAGKCANLKEVIEPTLKSFSDGIYTTGLFIIFGTGGGDSKYWQGFEDVFYNTYQYQFLTFLNIWDKDSIDTGCGFFHSSTVSKPGLIDIHGNSDIKSAYSVERKSREDVKNDPIKLNDRTMEEPFSPSEAFSRSKANLLCTKEATEQLRRVTFDKSIKNITREGVFIGEFTKTIKFVDRNMAELNYKDIEIAPLIIDYPTNPKTDIRGCWILWDTFYRDSLGNIPEDLYCVYHDPFAISKEKEFYSIKDSLGGTYIYEKPNSYTKLKGDRIIGEYVGRTEDTDEYNKQLFLAVIFCNGTLQYESDRGDVFPYAKRFNLTHLLKPSPEFLYQKELSKGGGGRKFGISIGSNMYRKSAGIQFLKNWLLTERGTDEVTGQVIRNINYFYSIAGLKEIIRFDGIKNADRVSTLIVLVYDVQEMMTNHELEHDDNNYEEDDYFNIYTD